MHIQVARAGDLPHRAPVDALSIVATEPISDDLDAEQSAAVFSRDAALIADALWNTLPGGTLDALLAMLMARRASQLHVPLAKFDRTDPVGS